MLYSKYSQDFLDYLSEGVRPRSTHASIAVAKAIADSLMLPSGQVDEPENTFKVLCKIDAANKLSPINEYVVLDTDTILDLILKFWMVRYYTLYPKSTIAGWEASKAIPNFFGLSYALSPEIVAVIETNFLEISKIYNGIVVVLNEGKQ